MNHSLILYWIVITTIQIVAYVVMMILIFYNTSFYFVTYFLSELTELSEKRDFDFKHLIAFLYLSTSRYRFVHRVETLPKNTREKLRQFRGSQRERLI